MKTSHFFLSFLIVTGTLVQSFTQTYFKEDVTFFQTQIPIYEDWLERQNLSGFFQFEEEPFRLDESRVTFNLVFLIEGITASINGIRQLNTKYQEETGFSLEEALFRKALHLFEVPPEVLTLKVESIPSLGELPGVGSRLQYKLDPILGKYFISPFSTLRSEVSDSVVIQDFELPSNLLLPQEMNIHDRTFRERERETCNLIKVNAENYFRSKGKGEIYFSYPEETNTLSFEVKNLKNEVIEEGIFTILDPHEKLSFTIKIVPTDSGGLKVLTRIDGKYGPGLYRPRSTDYHEMDPKFKTALEKYTERFANERVRNWIIKQ